MSANETAESILIVIKRLAKWLLYGVLLLAVFIGSVIGFVKMQNHLESRPKFISKLKDLELGEKISDVLFKMPGFVLDKKVKSRADPGDVYLNKELSIDIRVENGKISVIGYNCKNDLEEISVNGISCSGSGEEILEKYGKDLRVQCLRDKADSLSTSYRIYDVPKFGIRHHVLSNKVVGFSAMSTSELEQATGVDWGPCD